MEDDEDSPNPGADISHSGPKINKRKIKPGPQKIKTSRFIGVSLVRE